MGPPARRSKYIPVPCRDSGVIEAGYWLLTESLGREPKDIVRLQTRRGSADTFADWIDSCLRYCRVWTVLSGGRFRGFVVAQHHVDFSADFHFCGMACIGVRDVVQCTDDVFRPVCDSLRATIRTLYANIPVGNRVLVRLAKRVGFEEYIQPEGGYWHGRLQFS